MVNILVKPMNRGALIAALIVIGGGIGFVAYHDGAFLTTAGYDITKDMETSDIRVKGTFSEILLSSYSFDIASAYQGTVVSDDDFFAEEWGYIACTSPDDAPEATIIIAYDAALAPVEGTTYIAEGTLTYFTSFLIDGTTYSYAYIDAETLTEPWILD